jgi:CRP-like cAMP-binding protein
VLLVRESRLKIVRATEDGRESLAAVRQPGDLVGELRIGAITIVGPPPLATTSH